MDSVAGRAKKCPFFQISRPAIGPTRSSVLQVLRALPPGG